MGTTFAPFLAPEGYVSPSYWALVKELAVGPEVGQAVAHAARTRVRRLAGTVPTLNGAGEPILLLPGFLAGDYSLNVLAGTLRGAGYRTHRSRIHTNVACVNDTALRLERRLEVIAERADRRVRIVGHSLGGMLARGLAVRRPDLVAGIVAMGSPIMAPGTAHPVLVSAASMLVRLSRSGLPGMMSEDCIAGECARTTWEEFHGLMSPDVDFACLYSKWDGMVDWRACAHPDAVRIEVRASHVGLAVSPVVHARVLAELTRQRAATEAREQALAFSAG